MQVVRKRLQSWLITGDRWTQFAATVLLCLIVGTAVGGVFAFLGPILTPVFIVAFAVGLIMLREMQVSFFALVAVICLLPFAVLPIPNFAFSPTLLDLVLAALAITWVFRIARKKLPDIRGTALGAPLIVFMLLCCVSFVMGMGYGPLTTNLIRRFVELLLSMFLFFLVVNNVRREDHLEQIVSLLIVCGAIASFAGIVLYFLPQEMTIRILSALAIFRYPSGPGVLRYIEANSALPLRATSTSIDPNVLGGLLSVVAGLTAPQLVSRDPLPPFRWKRMYAWGINWSVVPVLGVMLVCLMLTFSRAAMAGLAGGLMVVAFMRYRKLLAFMLVVGVIVLLLPQAQLYLERFVQGVRGEDIATQMRFGEYKDAFILISRYPVFGVGFAGAPDIDTYLGVSSAYLLIAEETGLLGLAVFMSVLGLGIHQVIRHLGTLRQQPHLESIQLGLLAAILSITLSAVLDHYFFNINFQHSVALVWLCMGLGISGTMVAGGRPALPVVIPAKRPSMTHKEIA